MQGFNMGRYHAPASLDTSLAPPSKRTKLASSTSLNTTTKSKAPPTIRFEMPFAIWCSTCPSSSISTLIGQGVRFNALKTRVGNYHSTPIWAFRMKHTPCGGWIEIRTDPAASEFVVSEGARRREQGSDEVVAERVGGVLVGVGDSEKERRRNDAFAALEGVKEEKELLRGEAERVEELRSRQERDWRDPDERNRRLRAGFRPGRKAREVDGVRMEGLKERMGLGIEILEESEHDRRRAGLVEFGRFGKGIDVMAKPMFGTGGKGQKKGTTDTVGETKVDALRKELSGNSRAAVDPFSTSRSLSGLRKALPDSEVKGSWAGGIKLRSKDMPQPVAHPEKSDRLAATSQHERSGQADSALLKGQVSQRNMAVMRRAEDRGKDEDDRPLVDYESE